MRIIIIFLLKWCVFENLVIIEFIVNWLIVVDVRSNLYWFVVIFKFLVVKRIRYGIVIVIFIFSRNILIIKSL